MSAAVENRGPQLLGIDITFTGVAVIASLLRCYVRTRIVKAFGIDDWLMAIAAISFALYCAFSVTGVHYGTGQHQSNLAPQDIQLAKKYWWLCYVFYCTTMISSKMSIGYFLLRITATRTHSWIIYISMMFTVVTGAVFIFVAIFQCSPVSYFWNQYEGQSGTCLNIEAIIALSFVYSAINVFVDFSFALLPAFLVWGLQLDKKTKIAIIPLLAMGCIASSAVVARLGYIMNFRNPDFLWATVDIAIWSTVEQGLAITAGCLATLRPLLKRIIYRLGWSEPSAMRPSGYGPQLGNAISSRSKGSRGALASLNLTTITRTKEEDCDIKPSPAVGYPPGTCYQSSFVSSRSDWPSGMETVNASESQEELRRVEASPNELPDDASRGVVVTKTWVVTEGKHDV